MSDINTLEDFEFWLHWQNCLLKAFRSHQDIYRDGEIEAFRETFGEMLEILEQVEKLQDHERSLAYRLAYHASQHSRNWLAVCERAKKHAKGILKAQRETGKLNKDRTDYPQARRMIDQLIEAGELKRLASRSLKASAIIKTLDGQKIDRPGKRTIERWLKNLGQ